ncbi:MAG: hypothetical protein HN411_05710, partial [Waddliaceae bacterium]|nr:hypothetical protein [Waddliaceae bacterium]
DATVAETLTLTAAGATDGDITFTGTVGGTALGVVTINAARNVAGATFTAASLTQIAGSGTTAFTGAVNTTGATGVVGGVVDITTNGNIDFVSTITTTGGANGGAEGFNGGAVTLKSDTAGRIDLDGTVTTTGSAAAGNGAGGTGGAVTITADAGNINVAAITTTGGAGAGSGNGGDAGDLDITITLSTGNTITLEGTVTTTGGAGAAAGTGGNVTLDADDGLIDTNDQTITMSDGALTCESQTIDFGTADNTIITTGAIILQPDIAGRSIGIGDGASGDFDVSGDVIEAIQNGSSSITIGRADGTHVIIIEAIDFYDPVVIQTPSGGSIAVNGNITGYGNATVRLTGAGAVSTTLVTTLAANIETAGGHITIDDTVVLAEAADVILRTGAGSPGNISITGTVNGTAGGSTENLTLVSGTGSTTLDSAVGGSVPLGIIKLQSSTGSETGTMTFAGAVTATKIITYAEAYSVALNGGGTITSDCDFLNTGALTIAAGATFNGGLDTTTGPTTVTIGGTIATTNNRMDIGAVTLSGATILNTGNHADGILNVGAVTSAGNSLTLNSGSTAGATIGLTSMADTSGGLTITHAGGLVTVTGILGNSAAGNLIITNSIAGVTFDAAVTATTLTISDTTDGQTITFDGTLTATTALVTAAEGYNIAINGGGTITNECTFSNSGALTIGSTAIQFTGGVIAL